MSPCHISGILYVYIQVHSQSTRQPMHSSFVSGSLLRRTTFWCQVSGSNMMTMTITYHNHKHNHRNTIAVCVYQCVYMYVNVIYIYMHIYLYGFHLEVQPKFLSQFALDSSFQWHFALWFSCHSDGQNPQIQTLHLEYPNSRHPGN